MTPWSKSFWAEALAEKGDFSAAQGLLAEVVLKLTHPKLAAFVRDELLPAYQTSHQYVALSPLRGAASLALKKRKVHASPDVVASALGIAPSAAEVAMQESFERDE